MVYEIASFGVKNDGPKKRKYSEVFIDDRSDFERDRDRVIHSKAFRRLNQKTQVFKAGSGDHYRTRLIHSVEVAQVGRALARKLLVNEDLCEVIGLAHDLGHAPFGHAGQHALNKIMKEFGLHFEHNEQSKRIVEELEIAYPGFKGLNLSVEVREGLMKHQTAYDNEGKVFEKAAHLEAQLVNRADEIAYTNHDIDDGLRSGLISLKDLEGFELWREALEVVERQHGKMEEDILAKRVVSKMMFLMMEDLGAECARGIRDNKIGSVDDVVNFKGELAVFSQGMGEKVSRVQQFLYTNFYLHPKVVEETNFGERMIRELFYFYYKNPKEYPGGSADPVLIKDYIAGMTDGFLLKEYKRI